MTDLFDNYGHAFALVAAGPLLAALLVISKFPETARVELEDLNPGDISPKISES